MPERWSGSEPGIGSTMDTLRVETVGYIAAKKEMIAARFPFDGFGLVLRGHGSYRVGNGATVRIEAPAVFYIWPGPVFQYGPEAGSVWEERYLCFTGARVADWVRWRWLPRTGGARPLVEADTAVLLHQRICRCFAPFDDLPMDEAKLEVEQLAYELHRGAGLRADEPDKLDGLVKRWTKEPPGAGRLKAAARELGMSYSSFRQRFAERTGLTPHQFLLRIRVDQASLLLAQTDEPVKAVAHDCGFAGPESFNRVFRGVKGITPGEYRRRIALPQG